VATESFVERSWVEGMVGRMDQRVGEAASPRRHAPATGTADPLRVLVAEDDEDHLFLTVRALRSVEGVEIEVDTVRDGEEALDYVHQRGRFANRPRPHLILLDLKMPRVSGLEVLGALKADEELRTIPIVVLTSSDRPEDVQATYRLGGNSYVTKPVGLSGLHQGLAEVSTYWTAVASLPEPP
jgi:CheY-like chemotaxis protein